MENKYYRKATDREREASVALYKFFEQFALLTEAEGKSDGWGDMLDEAVKVESKYPWCHNTIAGIMKDISRTAEENSR